MSSPLVTFCVTAYNQERFVREAIAGAFAQTYSPLEILLSDDCSRDGTFSIMQEMAASYRGPHTVRINRNRQNLGAAKHFSRIYELVSGEFLVCSAGDDISLPQRTERVVDLWLKSNKQAVGIFSDAIIIDEDGRQVRANNFKVISPAPGDIIALSFLPSGSGTLHLRPLTDPRGFLQSWVLGATFGYDSRLWSVFGGLPADILQEDVILPFRALMLGRLAYIDEPLVRYRRHAGNVFPDNVEVSKRDSYRMRNQIARRNLYRAMVSDVSLGETMAFIDTALASNWRRELKSEIAVIEIDLTLTEKRSFAANAKGLMTCVFGNPTVHARRSIADKLKNKTKLGRLLWR